MGIVTVTLNPALDLETTTEALRPRDKLRCTTPRSDPGGGGINVARAIHALGGTARAAVALAGPAGQDVAAALLAAGIPVVALPAPGPTRSNLSVIEQATGNQYRFILPGPTWTTTDLDEAERVLRAAVAPGDLVVLSGSLPPGLPGAALTGLAARLTAAGARVVADTSGPALEALAADARGLALLRMDTAEAEALLGRTLPRAGDTAAAARALVLRGVAEAVIIARGAEGSVLSTSLGSWWAPAAHVPVVSVTGAGDSFVAAAVLSISRGESFAQALSCGCAAASAAVTTPATALFDPEVYASLLPGAVATPL